MNDLVVSKWWGLLKYRARSYMSEPLQKPWLQWPGSPGVFQKPDAFRKLCTLTFSSWSFFRPFKLWGMIAPLATITACLRGACFEVQVGLSCPLTDHLRSLIMAGNWAT